MPQFVDCPLPQATLVLERLDGDIDPDSAAELEAVNDGPGGIRDANGDAFDLVGVEPCRQRRSGHTNHAYGGDVDPGDRRPSIHGQPDLARVLSAETMEPQGREQAHETVWHALGHFRQGVVLGRWRCG